MCCSKCGETQRKIWVFGSGVLTACIALILVLLWPTWGEDILSSELSLSEGSMLYDTWLETPIPIHLQFHFFNWTNPEEIRNHEVKPHVMERGPYVFLEKHKRLNMTWNDNGTISYYQMRTWKFDESLSNGKLDDVITCLNPIAATVTNMMKDSNFLVKEFINFLLKRYNAPLFLKKTVLEFLFDGYDDPLLTFLKKFNSTAFDIPYTKFGWFVDRNNSVTYDGHFTMNTGHEADKPLGIITRWNGLNETHFFKGDCGKIYGTSGELWPPNMDPLTPKSIFVPDLCRSITVVYSNKFEAHGVEGSQWIGDDRIFDNGHLYEENRCFCLSENFNECPPSGILDISACKFGAPAAMSYPHFYMADKSYLDAVDGLTPNESLHRFTVALEPKTGIPLDLAARIQLNMFLRPDSIIEIYKDVQPVLMPIFWFAQRVSLSSSLASQLKLALLVPSIGVYISYGLFGLAAIIIAVGVYLTLTKKWIRRTHDNELNS